MQDDDHGIARAEPRGRNDDAEMFELAPVSLWLNDFSATSDSPLFARDLGPESNRDIAAAYPDRVIFFVDGRSSTRDRVAVIGGPVSLADLE